MFTNANDIEAGMDVYGSDGEKIGSVAEAVGQNDDTTVGGTASNDVLGDESRVVGGPSTGGGPGTLGDDTRVVGGRGTGGPGTLGDDTRVTGGYSTGGQGTVGSETSPAADAGSTAGFGGVSTDTDRVREEYAESEQVVVEEVPTGGGNFGTTGTQMETATTGVGTGYFTVDEGGFLGIGAKHLYVPLSAVDDVVPGDRVVLNCTKDEAESMYANEPAFLADNP